MQSMHLQPSSHEEIEYVTRFLWAKNGQPSEIHSQLSQVYGERAMKYQEVQLLCQQFGNGRIKNLGANDDSTFSLNKTEFLSQVITNQETEKATIQLKVSFDLYSSNYIENVLQFSETNLFLHNFVTVNGYPLSYMMTHNANGIENTRRKIIIAMQRAPD